MEDKSNIQMTAKERRENFWYYHKWHAVVALFLVFVILICSVQMCSKVSYDIHIMYAGPYEFKRTSSNGDLPPYANALTSLKQYSKDYNEDGTVSVDFLDLYLLTSKEMQDAEADKETELNYRLLMQNSETFVNNIMYSEFYVCLISPTLYSQYKVFNDVPIFSKIDEYVDDKDIIYSEEYHESDGTTLYFYDECAVYLSSTELSTLPVFSSLPEDTLVCLRIKSAIASHFGKEENERNYEISTDYIKNLLNA